MVALFPGEDNLVARLLVQGGNFSRQTGSLNPLIFQRICQVFVSRPEIDLFASTLIFQLPKSCVCFKDPQAWKVDALSFRWSGLRFYAFPPFSFLPRVLEEIAQEGADVALVAPFWPQRPWFPRLLPLLALIQNWRVVFSLCGRFPGEKESRRAFLLELQNSQQKLLGCPHAFLTIPILECFFKWCENTPCDPSTASLG